MKPKQQTGNVNATNVADSYIVHSLASVKKGYRHTYHVMPPVGWMNDPNGFSYAFGKYQLFFQFYPYGAAWNSMHWGHYTTEDFVKWQLQPTALAPSGTADRDGCYSGSAIVKDGKLYLMYTSVLGSRQTQSLAVSSDGVHFEKLGEVIKSDQLPKSCARSDFRDPKVFKRGELYYAVLGSLSTQQEGQILLYRSPDLFKWEYVGTLRRDMLTTRGIYECPDLISLGGKDILIASPQGYETQDWRYENLHSSIYMVGELNTEKGSFHIDDEDEIDGGMDFYAPQTLSAPDGRTIMIAWMQMWSRTTPTAQHGWVGSMTLPRELTLKDGKLYQAPVREIERYRWNEVHVDRVPLSGRSRLRMSRVPASSFRSRSNRVRRSAPASKSSATARMTPASTTTARATRWCSTVPAWASISPATSRSATQASAASEWTTGTDASQCASSSMYPAARCS